MLASGLLLKGRYRIERLIGQGGMGAVYEANHTGLRTRVAIKVLEGAEHSDADRARFTREARTAATLTTTHTVRVFDVDETDDGEPFLAMEFLEGHDLRAEFAHRRPSVDEVVHWTRQALAGLAEAHRAGIIHRDLKPENLFVTRVGAGRQLKIIDFGIAKMLSISPHGETLNSSIMGTPRYMSPEQIRGGIVDARSDIYAVGVLMYELATGRYPFEKGALSAYVKAVLSSDPEPITTYLPNAPPAFAASVMRCLAREPADRFASVRELDDALAVIAPEDTIAAPLDIAEMHVSLAASGAVQPTPSAPRTTRRSSGVKGVVCLALAVAGAITAAFISSRSTRANSDARADRPPIAEASAMASTPQFVPGAAAPSGGTRQAPLAVTTSPSAVPRIPTRAGATPTPTPAPPATAARSAPASTTPPRVEDAPAFL